MPATHTNSDERTVRPPPSRALATTRYEPPSAGVNVATASALASVVTVCFATEVCTWRESHCPPPFASAINLFSQLYLNTSTSSA